jgi:uncharacterized protein YeaC (DUF1315 family)
MRVLGSEQRMTTLEAAAIQQTRSNILPKEERISFGPNAQIVTTKKKNPSLSHRFGKTENERKALKKVKRKLKI